MAEVGRYSQEEYTSESFEKYLSMAGTAGPSDISPLIRNITRTLTSHEHLRSVMYKLGLRVVGLESENPGVLVKHIPEFVNTLNSVAGTAPLFFIFLSALSKRKCDDARITLLEAISRSEFEVESLIDLLTKDGTSETILDVLKASPDKVYPFIRETQALEDPTSIKNMSQVLPGLPPKYFKNYKSLEHMLESDNYGIRCCYLEILENLVLYFKSDGEIELISDILSTIKTHLCDVNYLVRARVLNILSNLAVKEAILKDMRNEIVGSIIGRVFDKTVIVRKKAVAILTQLLVNHPFHHRKDLNRKENCTNYNNNERIEADFDEFSSLMEKALSDITLLLDSTLKTDMVEILEFIKCSYLLKVGGSRKSIEKVLTLVFSKSKDIVVELFKDILDAKPQEIYQFFDNKFLYHILPSLNLNVQQILKNFYDAVFQKESISLLEASNYRPTESESMRLLKDTTETLFNSRNVLELKERTQVYAKMLSVIGRVRERLHQSHEIFKIVSKSNAKVIFFEPELIKRSVELFYSASQNPEKNCATFMHHICLGKDRLKIIEAAGWIALHQFYLLERIEKRFSSNDRRDEAECLRRSLDRASLSGIREQRKSIEDIRRSLSTGTAGIRMSIRLDSLNEAMKEKDEDEIADFFFYLKENELLKSPNALLYQFIPIVISSLDSSDTLTQSVAYRSLGRMMIASSTFFSNNYTRFLSALSHPSLIIRNNALVALHDFTIFYNSTIDQSLLFSLLDDPGLRKNALLCVFSLLHKNVIRIRGFSASIIKYLKEPTVSSIVVEFLCTFSSNNNVMSVIFYETFLSDLDSSYSTALSKYVDSGIQESLFLKCLKSTEQFSGGERYEELLEKLRRISKVFILSEKFVQTHIYRPEMKSIMECNAEGG